MLSPQVAIAAAVLALSGCAAIQGQNAKDSEQLLVEAGFQREPRSAAQGATRAGGGALPKRQLTAATQYDGTMYLFYDPDFCHCGYVGAGEEYAKLQELRKARADEHGKLMRMWNVQANGPDPAVWGPWKPEGLDVK